MKLEKWIDFFLCDNQLYIFLIWNEVLKTKVNIYVVGIYFILYILSFL